MNTTSLIFDINNCYYDRYKPPSQTNEFVQSSLFETLSKKVICFYDNNIETAKYLTSVRDLTNIENEQRFDVTMYNQIIGEYNKSGYNMFYNKNNTLPDNIALYCQAPLINSNRNIHVINSIALGFDKNTQPDYKYFKENNWNMELLINRLSTSFTYAFQCAKILNLDSIVLSHIGGGWFSSLYPNNYNDLYIASLEKALINFYKQYPNLIQNLKLSMMGNPNPNLIQNINKMFQNNNLTKHLIIFPIGYVPNIMDNENTLYMNAWDPHSYVGNGNKGDNSLDGFMGRNLLMHYLCCPFTNKYIQYIKIE